MPFGPPPSQLDSRSAAWLVGEAGLRLLAQVQRMATPELTRVFGQHGLFLRPTRGETNELSGNMLAHVLCLHRQGRQLEGAIQCLDSELPISSDSLSLVYCLFMLEACEDPSALLHEVARVLKPEGTALMISLNPWSLAHLRWFAPGRISSASSIERLANDAGLEMVRRQYVGPFLAGAKESIEGAPVLAWLDRFRAASLLVLRHREVGLTPLRKMASPVSLRPGMSAG